MKIENTIAHVTRTIKDYKSQPFVTCTPLFELMCEQLVSLLDSKSFDDCYSTIIDIIGWELKDY